MKYFLKALFFVVLCLSLTAAEEEMDSVIASVDGDAVSLGDILPSCRNRELELQSSLKGEELYNAVREVRKKALDELIDRKLILRDFETSKPFTIPEQAIERYIDDMALSAGVRSRTRFSIMVRESGSSMEALRKKVRENIIIQAMRSRRVYTHVSVTPKEVYDYYKTNIDKFSTPELWRISMLLVDKNRAGREEIIKTVSDKMNNGGSAGDFAELAVKYSSDPAASSGGDLGEMEPENLRSEFKKAINKAEIGKFYGPVKLNNGDAFLFITGIVPGVTADFEKESAKIRQELEKQRNMESLKKYIDHLRTHALIQYYL